MRIEMSFFFLVCLLNLHEDERSKPSAWVPVGWIPIYDPDLATGRSTRGLDSNPVRQLQIFHTCYRALLAEYVACQDHVVEVAWADGQNRLSFFCLGGIIGDQQEADRATCQGAVCHRCSVKRGNFLSTIRAPARHTPEIRRKVEEEAAGKNSPGGRPVVEWDADTKNSRPGPNCKFYPSSRKRAGCHLVWNAFWGVRCFCVYQMCMRDPMHQIDSGVIVQLLKAILRIYDERVESVLGVVGTAAEKLTSRLSAALGTRKNADGKR